MLKKNVSIYKCNTLTKIEEKNRMKFFEKKTIYKTTISL